MLTHAWLFPGQGSQYVQMGRYIWREKLPGEVLALAESISGLPLRSVIENGPEAKLRTPSYLEPSILALQAAHVLLLLDKGIRPDAVAGYSLGEIGALYSAGCLSLEEALRLASARGCILQRNAESGAWLTRSVSFGEAPVALPLDGAGNVFIAAYNSPREFTITGESLQILAVEEILLRRGATLSPVPVDGPWHSPLAAISARAIAELLLSFEIRPPRLPVCLATSGVFETESAAIRSSLSRQIDSPVRWTDTLETLWGAGIRSTLEIGPSRVLTSFVRANWAQRPYTSQFLDRPGGRAIDFALLKNQTALEKENSWTKSA